MTAIDGRDTPARRDDRHDATSLLANARRAVGERAWQLGGQWWAVAVVCAMALVALFVFFILAANIDVQRGAGTYELGQALKDGADVAIKAGAVTAGVLAVYRYWYRRYEPLIYFTACGTPDKPVLTDIEGRAVVPTSWLPTGLEPDARAQSWHNLPLIVLHRHTMNQLRIKDGAQVDLEFTTPQREHIWAVAFAYTLPARWDDEQLPIRLSKSLRVFFGMERDHPGDLVSPSGGGEGRPSPLPEGWQPVRVNARDYYRISQSTADGRALIWLASPHYCVRFRSRQRPAEVYASDDFGPAGSRVVEYSGIALRVHRRNALRYRGDS